MKDLNDIAMDTLEYLSQEIEKSGHNEVAALGAVAIEGFRFVGEKYGKESVLKLIDQIRDTIESDFVAGGDYQ